MSEKQWCSGQSYHGRMGFSPCSKKATSMHKGKPYCNTHDPVKAAARRDKSNAKWRAEYDAKDRQRKLSDAVCSAEREVIVAAYNVKFNPFESSVRQLVAAVDALDAAKKELHP